MEALDLPYIATTIANLSGIPIRIFQGDVRTFYHSPVYLPKDPICSCLDEILKLHAHICYFATSHFYYYGIVNHGETRLVLGPTRQIPDNDQELRELAFRTGVEPAEANAFVAGMKSIIHMPLESVMQMLCTVNYILNGEKSTLSDITIFEMEQETLSQAMEQQVNQGMWEPAPEPDLFQSPHNTFDLEQAMLHMVQCGDTASLRKWIAQAPAVRGGVLAPEQIRQQKNTFIVVATLVSRAAIRGGMETEDAFRLSDAYIQRCELLTFPERITNLQYRMVFDFTERMERIRHGKNPTRLALEVSGYIRRHMSETITTEAIAKSLYMSRPYLSRRFKEETGETLKDFILQEKTEEARRLLRYSSKSFPAISGYLGFSSQSHFTRVFKKYTGCTPGEYRERIQDSSST